jgi:multidrug transporter EmrE-like cation transporter
LTFNFALLVMAALCFTCGGVMMKYSDGLTRLMPSVLTGILFLAGAACQARAMRGEDMSVSYVVVLGLESVLAFVFGRVFFGESVSFSRLGALMLIVSGIALLRR